VAAGLDVNWDLKNYHYYDPFALLEGRIGFDVAPAQIQTYHNPLLDLWFYTLVQQIPSPRIIAAVMSLPTAIAGFLLLRLVARLFPAGFPDRWLWIAASFAIGMTGASGWAVIGMTMDEWPPAMLLVAALGIVVASIHARGRASATALGLAGFIAGLAMGLKLTYGMFALALVAAALACGAGWRGRARDATIAGACVVAGLALTYGFWGAILWHEFENPFFPYFNDVFRSPWWEPIAWFDRRFGPQDAMQAVFFPFYFARQSLAVGEIAFRDWRLAALLALAAAALVRRLAARPAPTTLAVTPAWTFLSVFTAVAYLVWLKLYSIYRYLVPLEMLSGPLIVACALYVVPGRNARRAAIVALALLLVGSTRKAEWGHLPFRGAYFDVAVPEILPKSLVLVGPFDPMAYAIPFFRHDARFVSPQNNFLDVHQTNLMAQQIAKLLATHPGPLYCLDVKGFAHTEPVLAHFGLVRDEKSCLTVRSYLDDNSMQVCRLHRATR
jgi:hypothetical protein